MSQMFSAPSLDVLLIAGRALSLFAALLVFAWAFRHWRRAAAKDAQRVFEQLDLVRSELLIMKEVMHSAAHRVDSMAQRATHETRIVAPASGPARGYEIAARMARNGSAKEELMRSCGLTAHEAELLIKLHGQKSAAPTELIGRQVKAPAQAASTKPVEKAMSQPAAKVPAQRPSIQAPTPAPVRVQRSRLVAVG